jgi:hypothetical protein
MRGFGVSCYNEHYQLTKDLGHAYLKHKILLNLSTVGNTLINLYHKNAYGAHGKNTLLDKQRVSLFSHLYRAS